MIRAGKFSFRPFIFSGNVRFFSFCTPCLFHIVIFVVLKRKASYYVIAEKWLKRTYIMNGRERRREEGREIEKAACSAGAGSVLSAGVGRRRAGGGVEA